MDKQAAHTLISRYSQPLADHLADTPRSELERAGSDVIDRWKDTDLPGFVAPAALGGTGASLDDILGLQMALGYFSPSLAAATTMHHLSMLSLADFGESTDEEDERAVVVELIKSRVVIASAFSERVPNGSVFRPNMTGRRGPEETVVLNGRKAPCSLSHSMDFLMASYLDEDSQRAVALVPSSTEGVSVTDIWEAPVLKASQSELVAFDGVAVPADLTFTNNDFDADESLEKAAYQIFGVLISGAYLGAAHRALDELDDGKPVDENLLVQAKAHLTVQLFALRAITLAHTGNRPSDQDLVDLLLIRTSLKSALAEVAAILSTLRGGGRYSSNADLNYFIEVLHAYEYHPPSRVETVHAVMSQAASGGFSYTDHS